MNYTHASATLAFWWHETNYFSCLDGHCVVHRRLLSTVMIGRKFPNRSLFFLLIYSQHPSATQRILTHFLFVFLCSRWVHPVSVTMRSPPIPLFCFLCVPSVRQARLPFGDMRLTFFCVSPLLPLHTTFFSGWVFTPIPIAICCALRSVRQRRFRNAKDTNTFSLCVCVQEVSPSRQCNYAPPSHPTLLFSFNAQRASAMIKLPTVLTGFVHDMLDFDVSADISRLQDVRNRKVLSTYCVIAIR